MEAILTIPKFLGKIGRMFYGEYSYENEELANIRKEILDISTIPDTSDDKIQLKEDLNLFLKDSKVALNKIKKEERNGKAK